MKQMTLDTAFEKLPQRETPGEKTERTPPARNAGNLLALICLSLWTAAVGSAQGNYGYTIYYDGVGNGAQVQLSAPGSGSFSSPNGLAVDLSDNLYIADTGNNRILKVVPGTTTATVFTISGLSSPATLSSPNQLGIDSAGNLYITDTGNNRIVKVSPSGSGSVLSTGSYALSAPQGVAVDPSGDVFISDSQNHRIIEIPSGGSATILSPSGISLATTTPTGLAIDTYGNLYIVDVANNQVIEVNTSLQGSTVSFTSETAGTSSTSLVSPTAVTVANNGAVYITDPGAYRIAVIDPQDDNYDFLMDDIVDIWGTSQFSSLGGIATNSKGTVYVTSPSLDQVLVYQQGSADFAHSALGGSGTTLTLNFNLSPGFFGTSPGNTIINSVAISTAGAQTADFTIASDGCTGASGNFQGYCTVNVQFTPTAAGLRRGALVLSFSNTSPYTYYDSGNFTVPLFGIGDAPVAALSPEIGSHLSTGTLTFPQAFEPLQTAYDGAGNIYVTDGPNNRVLIVPKGGGNATVVSIPAIPTAPAGLSNPTGLAIDGAGNLFIADSGNNRIVEVTQGTSMVVAACSAAPIIFDLSSDTQNGGWGDSTPCADSNAPFSDRGTTYTFNNPQSLFIDSAGNLTVNDAGNHKIVQLAPNYYYTKDNTLALSNVFALSTGSLSSGTNSSFAVDTSEGLYISDETNNRVIHVDRFGQTSVVDFSALATALTSPHSVALDPMGNLYVMDAGGPSGTPRIVQEIITPTSTQLNMIAYAGDFNLGSSPNGLAVDNFGNLLVEDYSGDPGTGHLTQINAGQSSQAFPDTPMSSTSSPQTVTVTNLGDQPLNFSANPGYTSNFSLNASDLNLCTSDTSLTTGASCDVSILFTPQSTGSLNANITLTDNTQNVVDSTQQIAASGNATAAIAPPPPSATPTLFLSVSPQSLNVTYQQDTAFSGGSQTIYVGEFGTANTASWTAAFSPAAPWISLSTTNGSVPTAEKVTLNPAGLAPGVYTTSITFTVPSAIVAVAPVSVAVTLTVLAPAAISVTPTAISGGANLGQTTPIVVPLTINPPGITWSLQQGMPAQPWLTIGSSSGTAPSTVNLSMDPTNLGGGRYYASLILTSPGAPNSPLTIPVVFVVATGLQDRAPLLNGASFAPASDDQVSPNELISLFLPGIGCPATPGAAPAVTFNGATAQVLNYSSGQINVVLPETVGYGALVVSCAGAPDWSFSGLSVVQAIPGLFTMNFSGTGPGAILNQDGTMNSAANAASPGSTVSVYGTGFGAYNAASADGLRRLSGTVTATIGGLPATVTYAGQAPGMTLALSQINVQIPAAAASGAATQIVLTVSNGDSQATTQAGVTLAVE